MKENFLQNHESQINFFFDITTCKAFVKQQEFKLYKTIFFC